MTTPGPNEILRPQDHLPAEPLTFYTGTHMPHWLWDPRVDFPLFVCHRTLARYRTLRPATRAWALDSGGFTELATHGRWTTTPREYVAATARYDREIGGLEWAAPQDWMCEPAIRHGGAWNGRRYAGTGLTVAEHQARTVANWLELAALWPEHSDEDNPYMPVLQGETVDDYHACAQMYADAGVHLEHFPLVGLGSVCRLQATGRFLRLAEELTPRLALHGFGVKFQGIAAASAHLTSADSLAWSYHARRRPPLPGHETRHKACNNCPEYAAAWRERLLAA